MADNNKKTERFTVKIKKDNLKKAHIVVVDEKKYCIHGFEFLNPEEKAVIEKNVPQKILEILHKRGAKYIIENK